MEYANNNNISRTTVINHSLSCMSDNTSPQITIYSCEFNKCYFDFLKLEIETIKRFVTFITLLSQ